MHSCCETSRVPLEFDLRELESLRGLTEHKEIAIARAMDYCVKNRISPPEWLVEAATSLLIDLLKRERPTTRGRTASCIARLRHEMWDVERWDAVKTVREIRQRCKREQTAQKALPAAAVPESYKKRLLKFRKWLNQGTFNCAAKLLAGREALASASTINASYKKIEATRSGPTPPAGAWFDDPFLKQLGLQGSQERTTGRNILDISDLT
jgi:hypothetical protein